MKGTIHRGKTYEEDEENRKWLLTSHKNRYENELTTNLMKEELRDLTEPNTTEVTKQFTIEKYPTVYQMTSEITGKLNHNTTFREIFETLFPCTSIAGTPKQTALQWIQQLENFNRDIYCGSVGYIAPDGTSSFNVAIRTLLYNETANKIYYGSGGAITEQSKPLEEFTEVQTKTAFLHVEPTKFKLLETIGLHDGTLFLLDEHMKRLEKSAIYFQYPFDKEQCIQEVSSYLTSHPHQSWRIRLTVDENGICESTIQPQSLVKEKQHAKLASHPINKDNLLHYHKTTNRSIYEQFTQTEPTYFEILMWNEQLEITEFTIGNIVIEKNGELITPPVSCGLLAGTFRNDLLVRGIIKEAKIHKSDLPYAENIWLINSVRKWVPIHLDI